MKLRQINIQYLPEHDRLLMRIASGTDQEVLLWLTRRCVKLLWPVLISLARSVPDIAAQSDPDTRLALLGMRHEGALLRSDFSKPYEARPQHPLGSEPLLVARAQTQRNDNGSFTLRLLPAKGQGIDLGLDEALLHSVCALLRKVASQTDWDLQLDWPLALTSADQRTTLN